MDHLQQKKLELLAPAGDMQSLLAAVAAGADAVYLGGANFSARQYAQNFELEDLRKAVDLLHLRHKRIYVTVNTLLADSELPPALTFLKELYNMGVDAVIIQDLGLIHLARRYLPDLELHASTQMTVHNREGALFLKDLGIRRIVLARELTAAEVALIAEAGVEVEVFIHGALCISFSGQCLFSSMIGGRSGNRGRCAQPCRLEYQLINENGPLKTEGSYLLSPKDLALAEMIPVLAKSGVSSLKIEGRMKRSEYVYTVVKVYRRLLDRFAEDPGGFRVEPGEFQELAESFNRGFSTGYFGGNRNYQIMGFNKPNNRGVYMGRVMGFDVNSQKVTLKLEAGLALGDEVEIWVSQGGRQVGTIHDLSVEGRQVESATGGMKVSFGFQGKMNTGDRVFKVFSMKNREETIQAFASDNPALKIPCRVDVKGSLGEPLKITYTDEEGNYGTAASTMPLQEAINKPLTDEVLHDQLGRLGNTTFLLTRLHNETQENVMIPISELNQMRRAAITELHDNRLGQYRRTPLGLEVKELFALEKKRNNYFKRITPLMSVWVADLAGVKEAVSAGADLIYAGGDELTHFHWDERSLKEAITLAHEMGIRLVMGFPRINRDGERNDASFLFDAILNIADDGVMVSDLGALNRVLAQSNKPVFLNYTLNFFNSAAVESIVQKRVKQITLSPELTVAQVEEIRSRDAEVNLECIVHGPLELMVSEYCPIDATQSKTPGKCQFSCKKSRYYLRDRLNYDFPVYMDQFCRLHLLNCNDLCLYADLNRLFKIPGLTMRLELKTFDAASVSMIVKAYKKAIQYLANEMEIPDPENAIRKFKSLSGRGITKGHYFRGVE